MIQQYIDKISSKDDLTKSEAAECLEKVFTGDVPDDQIASLLGGLADKGEAVSEINGFVETLLKHKVLVYGVEGAVDTCGTGGSGKDRFNVGTTMAFILAAGGYPVAKHGNRGSAKPNGSFDLLESLGVYFETTPDEEAKLFQKHNLVFIFARTHHPVMKYVGPVRAQLGRRTIFNIIGPLCNPASLDYQVVGVSNEALGEKLINVLKDLGRKRAMVVFGEPGIDELSISGKSTYWLLKEDGEIEKHEFDPAIVGIEVREFDSIPGGECEQNADLFYKIISGEECDGLLDMVCLNAGAAIYTMGKALSITDGFQTAKELIKDGKVKEFFNEYKLSSDKYRKA